VKTRDWKKREREKYGGAVEKAGLENAEPNFTRVEKAGPPSIEREMDKYKHCNFNCNCIVIFS